MQAPWDILGWEQGRRDPAPTGTTSTASGQAAALHTPPVLTEAKERSQRRGQGAACQCHRRESRGVCCFLQLN